MTFVPRFVRKVGAPDKGLPPSPPEELQNFRNIPAWVLLGEPGAGKSTMFSFEAEATGGKWLRIAEFIHPEIDEAWRGKTLFLDGLDEVRAGTGSNSIALQIRQQLKRLGNPHFRIACRAADWYGDSDIADLKLASSNLEIQQLQLEPLCEKDIHTILHDNHGLKKPEDFVEKAEQRGIAGLLSNPQTLGLLVKAIESKDWPETRFDTYRLACETLAEEDNKRHRDQARIKPHSIESVLDAAGQLCAVLLLSDQIGIALDPTHTSTGYVSLNDCMPPDTEAASLVLRRKLFRPDGIERVAPTHRSVAEFLAARWMARQIDRGLPLGRVLNLLLGHDGRTVAGLRGLYAWLATHSTKARLRLIAADPLTVTIYGDAKTMSVSDKQAILNTLGREARNYPGFRWNSTSHHQLGTLCDPALFAEFLVILKAPERDDGSQSFVHCILDILHEGTKLTNLATTLEEIVRDATRWPMVRNDALRTLLKSGEHSQIALTLMSDIVSDKVSDEDDELTGQILQFLYPEHIKSHDLLKYLHTPKNPDLIGKYFWFWAHDLPDRVPAEELPSILDGLCKQKAVQFNADHIQSLGEMVEKLLVRGIVEQGDAMPDERLFAWLGLGEDEYGGVQRDKLARDTISKWFGSRPARYKALLALCFQQCEHHEHKRYCVHKHLSRLQDAAVPEDIGLWHMEHAATTVNDELAQIHLEEAVSSLINQRGTTGLSLERIEEWAAANSERKPWLAPLLAWEIPEWRVEQAANKKSRRAAKKEIREKRTLNLKSHLEQIAAGAAPANLMYELAGVWADMYSDTHGESPIARFDAYCANGETILAATERGLPRCPEREDLPDESAIINLAIKQREHSIRRPCLVGMELRWYRGGDEIDKLSEGALRRMVAFRLTYGANSTPDWFLYLVKQRPVLVADVLTKYASTTLNSSSEYVDSVYPLAHDADYREVAALAAPRLLGLFPVRAKAGKLQYLESLLKAALKYAPHALPNLIAKKLASKGMDVSQRVYWLTAATLLDPQKHEVDLWKYIGKSKDRVGLLSSFMLEHFGRENDLDYTLSINSIGKLIENLAPQADSNWSSGGGIVTTEKRNGDHIRSLITRLSTTTTQAAEHELDRLLTVKALHKWKPSLEDARHGLKQRIRESHFHFESPEEVAQILANQSPIHATDLTALVLDHLDDIAIEIRQGNDDGFRAFWNLVRREGKQHFTPREENHCRDVLLPRLRARLNPLEIECQPEGDFANDKRADIRLSFRGKVVLPIEIKRNSNDSLWSALRDQLINQYAIDPCADGYGIYLVLWFGSNGMPQPIDGGKKPRSATELKTRLEALLDPMERSRIFVRVLDVTLPH